jgi:antirestriction protein ArdC
LNYKDCSIQCGISRVAALWTLCRYRHNVHATGHEKRLNRHAQEKTNFDFGSKDYSKEELVAELGSAFLCAEAHIDNSVIDNNAVYLSGWVKELEEDKKLIIYASAKAGKAVNYIRNKRGEE